MKAILTWHSVDNSSSVVSVTAAQLERQLDWLASGRVRVVPLASLVSDSMDGDAIALTFDDGFANFSTVAAALLRARSLAATVFVVPSRVGATKDWDTSTQVDRLPSMRLMSWDDIRSVNRDGFEIGAHSLTHACLAGLDSGTLAVEVEECIAEIEESIGKRPSAFAYPYGKYDSASVAAVSKTCSIACTTRFDLVTDTDRPFELPRLDTYYFRDNRILEEWGTSRFNAYIKLRKAGRSVKNAISFVTDRHR